MAIQFQCAACGQPIEVDDEMAHQAVTCPYCRKVVTAPQVSDPTIHAAAPPARAPEAPEGPFSSFPLPATPPAPALESNRVGYVALGFASVSLILLAVYCGGMLKITYEMIAPLGPNPSQEQVQKVMQEQLPKKMEAQRGLNALMLLSIGLFPLAGISCAVVSLVQRRTPRWPAIASLIVLCPLMLCGFISLLLSFLGGFAAGAAGGG